MASSSTSHEEFISMREIGVGSYELKVNYAQTQNSSKEGFIYSPKFIFCGHECKIGWTNCSQEREPLLMFVLRSKPSNVKATLDLSLLNKDRNPSLTISTRDSFARPLLIMRRNKFKEECLIDGFFLLRCTIFNVGGVNKDLGYLLDSSEEMADVIFEVDGEIFRVHTAILAAKSHVLRGEIGSMDETRTSRIKINNTKVNVFKCLIQYMYTNSFEAEDNVVVENLLVAADRYAMDSLRMMCEERLCKNVSLNTVTSSLALAVQHDCSRLKDACLDFAAKLENHVQLGLTDGYLQLMRNFPLIFYEHRERVTRSFSFKKLVGNRYTN